MTIDKRVLRAIKYLEGKDVYQAIAALLEERDKLRDENAVLRVAEKHHKQTSDELFSARHGQPLPQSAKAVLESLERDCCGTFVGSPHRVTCKKYSKYGTTTDNTGVTNG